MSEINNELEVLTADVDVAKEETRRLLTGEYTLTLESGKVVTLKRWGAISYILAQQYLTVLYKEHSDPFEKTNAIFAVILISLYGGEKLSADDLDKLYTGEEINKIFLYILKEEKLLPDVDEVEEPLPLQEDTTS